MDAHDDRDDTPLHTATRTGNLDIVLVSQLHLPPPDGRTVHSLIVADVTTRIFHSLSFILPVHSSSFHPSDDVTQKETINTIQDLKGLLT